jgi:hypothetical protein
MPEEFEQAAELAYVTAGLAFAAGRDDLAREIVAEGLQHNPGEERLLALHAQLAARE